VELAVTVLALSLALLITAPAVAQVGSEEEARALFEQAAEAAAAGRTAEARDLFRRSLELFPTAAAAFNLGLVSQEHGDPLAALELAEALLGGAHGPLDDARRPEVTALRDGALAAVATLDVRIVGPPRASVRVDGRLAGEATPAAPLAVRLNPGAHVVRAEAPDHVAAQRSMTFERGQERTVVLELIADRPVTPDPEPEPLTPPDGDERDEPRRRLPGWAWAIFAGAVAAVTVSLAVWGARRADHLPDDLAFGRAETLVGAGR
jgi:hypothetical protein